MKEIQIHKKYILISTSTKIIFYIILIMKQLKSLYNFICKNKIIFALILGTLIYYFYSCNNINIEGYAPENSCKACCHSAFSTGERLVDEGEEAIDGGRHYKECLVGRDQNGDYAWGCKNVQNLETDPECEDSHNVVLKCYTTSDASDINKPSLIDIISDEVKLADIGFPLNVASEISNIFPDDGRGPRQSQSQVRCSFLPDYEDEGKLLMDIITSVEQMVQHGIDEPSARNVLNVVLGHTTGDENEGECIVNPDYCQNYNDDEEGCIYNGWEACRWVPILPGPGDRRGAHGPGTRRSSAGACVTKDNPCDLEGDMCISAPGCTYNAPKLPFNPHSFHISIETKDFNNY